MENDQERYYEEEEQEEVTAAVEDKEAPANDVDDMKYFMEIIRYLRSTIRSGTSVPMTRGEKKIVDANKLLRMIDDLEENLPDAIQYGMQMYDDRERIMSNAEKSAQNQVASAGMKADAMRAKAREEAEQMIADANDEAQAIIADAQDRADHMVSESEIVRQAREEARIIRNDARVEASEMRLKATHDAYQLLTSVEDELSEACKSIRRRRSELGDDED